MVLPRLRGFCWAQDLVVQTQAASLSRLSQEQKKGKGAKTVIQAKQESVDRLVSVLLPSPRKAGLIPEGNPHLETLR
jgi:hypothetical protein